MKVARNELLHLVSLVQLSLVMVVGKHVLLGESAYYVSRESNRTRGRETRQPHPPHLRQPNATRGGVVKPPPNRKTEAFLCRLRVGRFPEHCGRSMGWTLSVV